MLHAIELVQVTRRCFSDHLQNPTNGLSNLVLPVQAAFGGRVVGIIPRAILGPANRNEVSLDATAFSLFYDSMCNGYLWPKLHGIPASEPTAMAIAAYEQANLEMAKYLAQQSDSNTVLWIHDFHFLKVASNFRTLYGACKRIGFFMHAPIHCDSLNDSTASLIKGLTAYDYIGVQTATDAHVLRDMLEKYNAKHVPPISIHPVYPSKTSVCEADQIHSLQRSKRSFSFLTAGRADPTKGHSYVIEGFCEYMQRLDSSIEKRPVLKVLATPTRLTTPGYRQVFEELRLISERRGDGLAEVPIEFVHGPLPSDKFDAELLRTDCLILLSHRDGMNLIAKEYIALRGRGRPGVLVLSEGVGARHELLGCIIAKGSKPTEVADALERVVSLTSDEVYRRWTSLCDAVEGNSAETWAKSFLEGLLTARIYETTSQ